MRETLALEIFQTNRILCPTTRGSVRTAARIKMLTGDHPEVAPIEAWVNEINERSERMSCYWNRE